MNFLYIIIVISTLSALIPVLVGYKERNLLWYYVLISFFADGVGIFCFLKHDTNSWGINTFFVLEWILISTYLIQNCLTGRKRNYGYVFSVMVGIAFMIETLAVNPEGGNLQGSALFYVFYIFGALMGFYRVTQDIKIVKIEKSSLFIFCAGLLLYASGSLIMILLKQKLDDHNKFVGYMWIVHDILNIIKNIGIAFTLQLQKRKPL